MFPASVPSRRSVSRNIFASTKAMSESPWNAWHIAVAIKPISPPKATHHPNHNTDAAKPAVGKSNVHTPGSTALVGC